MELASYAKKINFPLTTVLSFVLKTLCNPLLLLFVKKTRIHTLFLLQKPLNLLADSSYDYRIMDRNCHSVISYTIDQMILAAINNEKFKKLGRIDNQFCEEELVKPEIKHEEPLLVGFFILQYAKLRLSELYYKFFIRNFAMLASMRR